MEKRALFRGRDTLGRPLIHLVEPGTGYGLDSTSGLDKVANHEHLPQVRELIESIAPQPGRLYLVNSALGAGEYVGFNLRGDWFTERGLLHAPPGWDDIPVWDIDARRRAANATEDVAGYGTQAWGYPTFYNAHRYQHHVNKDPNAARGYILGAFYDHRMHRVVLVSELIRDLCAQHGGLDVYDRIGRGDFVDSSMGAKVPYDECALCGHKARNPAEYCKHVNNQDPKFGMGKILPNGQKCGVYNHQPRFFDDSFVFVGAERSAKVMGVLEAKGQRAYGQTVYPYAPGGHKLAAVEPTQKQEEAERLSQALRADQARTEGRSLSAQLTRVLQGDPAAAKANRKAPEDSAKQAIENAQANGEEKLAAHAKWAEILKHIPAPPPYARSFVESHAARMPSLPDDILDACCDDPMASLAGLSHHGVVLRPDEFQYMMLGKENPDMARGYRSGGIVFRPEPMAFDHLPEILPGPRPAPGLMETLRQVLGPFLEQRSFAPAAIRIRITKVVPVNARSDFAHDDPVLSPLSHRYNDYRAGLLMQPPDLRGVSVSLPEIYDLGQEVKLADATQEISRFLFCLAYWPGLSVG